MQLGGHISKRRRTDFIRSFLALFLSFNLVMPSNAQAASMAQLMAVPGFVNLVMTIANLNKAMREAAENPMDQWRRQNVRHAMGMMPLAIRGLAEEFKANKLHNSDLPIVQKILGGFIDVNAADVYKKFLASPDKRLIPNVGKDFPVQMGAGAKSGTESLVFNSGAAKNASGVMLSDDKGASKSLTKSGPGYEEDLAPLVVGPDPRAAGAAKTASGADLTFNENASKAGVSPSSESVPSEKAPTPFLKQIQRDLSSVEAGITISPINPPKSNLDEGYLDEAPKAKASKPGKRSTARDTKNYQMKTSPKYWTVGVLRLVELERFAHAEEDGNKAAEFLFGLAAIMAAVAPIAVASIQANADKNIARVNRDGQIAMTNISAGTSKYLATQQKEIALEQAGIAQEISQENQHAATERLQMQLSALEKARNEAAQVEAQKRAYQEKLDNDRIALAKEQAAAAKELADVQFRAQLTAAGMSEGFAGTVNSATGAGMGLSRSPSGAAVGSLAAASTGFSGTAAPISVTQSAQSAATGTVGANRAVMPAGLTVARPTENTVRRLLTSATAESVASADQEAEADLAKAGQRAVKKRPVLRGRAVAKKTSAPRARVASLVETEEQMSRPLRGVMARQSLVHGSSGGQKNYTEETVSKPSGLARFADRALPRGSFAESLSANEGVPHAAPSGDQVYEEGGGHSPLRSRGAYNAPADDVLPMLGASGGLQPRRDIGIRGR